MLSSQASGSIEFQAAPGPSVQFWGMSYSLPSQLASSDTLPLGIVVSTCLYEACPWPGLTWSFNTCTSPWLGLFYMTLSSESQKWKPNWPSSSFSRQDIHCKCLASWDMDPPSPSSVYLWSSQPQPNCEVMLFSAHSEEGLNGGRRGMIRASIPQGISLPLGSDSMLIMKVLSWEIPWHFHKYAGSITGKKTKTLCGYPWNQCVISFSFINLSGGKILWKS